MANPSHQDDTHMELSQDVLNVYEGQRAMNELIARLQEAMGNPNMREDLSATMQALLYDPTFMTEEEGTKRPPCGTPQVPPSCHAQEDEGPINMHEDTPHQPILDGAPYPTLSQEKEGSQPPITSDSDVAPWRQHVQSSPSQVKKRQSISILKFAKVKKGKRDECKKKKRKAPSSPSSSPSSWGKSSYSSSSLSKDEDYYSSPKRTHGKEKERKANNVKRRSKCYSKFKEGAKSITFLTYDGTFGALDKVLAFIQQFDAAFRDENFSESSKLRNVSMHFTKAARQWWSGLCA